MAEILQISKELYDELLSQISDQRKALTILEQNNVLMRQALEAVEFNSGQYLEIYCCWCGGHIKKGHKPDCRRQRALGIDTEPKDKP